MTALYLILGVVGVITLVMLLPVTVCAGYDNGPWAQVRVGGLRVYRYPPKKKRAKKAMWKAEKAARKEAAQAEDPKEGQKLTAKKALTVCRLVKESLKRLKLRLCVPTVECLLIYGGGDAAKTAVTYGELNAAVYALLGFAGNYLEIQNVGMDIRPDFENARLLVRGKIEIQGRVGNILLAFLRVLVYLYTVRDTINDIRQ